MANTTTHEAILPLVMNVFVPFKMYASPSFTQRVRMPETSEPHWGSVVA